MTTKHAKSQRTPGRKKSRGVKEEASDAASRKTAATPARKGKDNLRQRAEWFQRRRGGAKL